MSLHKTDFWTPILGFTIAGFSSIQFDSYIKPLIFAFIGGAISWLGKVVIKALFIYVRDKIKGDGKLKK